MSSFVQSRKLLIVILLLASLLRLWRLDRVPVSLFTDELDVGYQAYSILKTGKDYFGNPWPLHFQSYVEYRAPLYIYSTVPSVAVFGITPYGVRLPAAIFGILGVLMLYFLVKEIDKSETLALTSAFLMALSPWHIHYSRAGFEVSELLFLILGAIYFFLKSIKKPKFLWVSALLLGLAPWTYSTAKLFAPALIIFLAFVWSKDLVKFPRKHLIRVVLVLLVLILPLIYVVVFGGGAYRFKNISVLGDQSTISEISLARLSDAQVRNTYNGGIVPKIASRIVNNKFVVWTSKISTNYLESFSTQFLFLKGDISSRHSVVGVGQFYKLDAIFLVLGIILFFKSKLDGGAESKKNKAVISFWVIFGAVPSSLTIEGGGHATRLILILPPLIFLISFGLVETVNFIKNRFYKKIFILSYAVLLLISLFFYQYNYWVRYPWYSEKSWYAGYKEAIEAVKEYENQYDKIVITNAEERPYIFLASYYPYDPNVWQRGFGEGYVAGFGDLKKVGKFYFGQVEGKIGMDKLSLVMDEDTLYIASKREIAPNLISEPSRVPAGLHLVRVITLPSGEPAFYLLEKK